MKHFDVPLQYKDSIVKHVKNFRLQADKLKKNLTPSLLQAGDLQFYLPRNFGFCYGVENAISLTNNIIDNNTENKRIFLLSELIHNPIINQHLIEKGVQFLMHNDGRNIIPFDTLRSDDIVIIPAFGTTIEIENQLKQIGIDIQRYYSTCPFVEKVWKKGKELLDDNYTIIIHGKPEHEETKATFSHVTQSKNACVIIRDQTEANLLAQYIRKEKNTATFITDFAGKHTPNFNPEKDLQRIGVINQTTMLATETQAIANFLKQSLIDSYQLTDDKVQNHFADTRDTLCYATNENQKAVEYMVKNHPLDLVIVIGGHNSSNTCNLYKIAHQHASAIFITNEKDLTDKHTAQHFNVYEKKIETRTHEYFNSLKRRIGIVIGASCPDSEIDFVIKKILRFYYNNEEAEQQFNTLAKAFIPSSSHN